MRRIVFSLTVAAAVALVAGAAWAEQTLTIPGTGASQVLLQALGEAFAKQRSGARVEVPDSIGSGGGIKAAGEGKAQFGRVARKLKEKEKDYGLTYAAFAKMPVVFVVNPSVRIKGLTTAQAADLFAGKVSNWKELGGPDKKVRVSTRAEGESTLEALRASLNGWAGLKMSPQVKLSDTENENIEVISSVDGAVGYTAYDIAVTRKLVILALDGVKPTDSAYPPLMEFALVYKADGFGGLAREFLDFLFSPGAAKVIKQHGGTVVSR